MIHLSIKIKITPEYECEKRLNNLNRLFFILLQIKITASSCNFVKAIAIDRRLSPAKVIDFLSIYHPYILAGCHQRKFAGDSRLSPATFHW